MTKQTFDFNGIRIRVLSSNAFAGDFARQFMQFQSDREPLLACHATIAFDLFCQCRCCVHAFPIRQFTAPHNFK